MYRHAGEKPWLCWNVHNDWCRLQQRLLLEVGWTPIVGNDTNVCSPTIEEGSVYLNFNSDLNLPSMWMHFPIEFTFLFSKKLAFWHSDFLCSLNDLEKFAGTFETLSDDSCAAALARKSRWPWREKRQDRYFELIGCTTEGASRSQFENGVGWWRHVERHPNYIPSENNPEPYYEHGVGILLWEQRFCGKVIRLDVDEKSGHCNKYVSNKMEKRGKAEELDTYYKINTVAKRLGIDHLLDS